MDIMDVRDYLVSLPLCEECQPFGEEIAVYKIEGKMFACTAFDRPGLTMNLSYEKYAIPT